MTKHSSLWLHTSAKYGHVWASQAHKWTLHGPCRRTRRRPELNATAEPSHGPGQHHIARRSPRSSPTCSPSAYPYTAAYYARAANLLSLDQRIAIKQNIAATASRCRRTHPCLQIHCPPPLNQYHNGWTARHQLRNTRGEMEIACSEGQGGMKARLGISFPTNAAIDYCL